MKIRTKLTLIFTTVTATLLLVISLSIYFLSLRYNKNVFYAQLKERAQITAQLYLKKDEVDANIYQEIREKFFQSLPQEVEEIYSVSKEPRLIADTYQWHYPDDLYNKIIQNNYAEFSTGKNQGVGLLYSDNQGDFIIMVQAYDELGNNKLANLLNILLIIFFLSTLFVYVLGKYLAFEALKPITAIVRRVNEISVSNLNLRVDAGNGQDEISELSHTFNKMLERLETSFELQKTFITNASHELRNPLTAILGEVEITLNKSRQEKEYIQSLQKISTEAERLQELTSNLLSLSKSGLQRKDLHISTIRMDEFLWELIKLLEKKIPDCHIVIEFLNLPEDPDLLIIQGNKMLLKTAFSNILENACKFSNNDKVLLQLLASNIGIEIRIIDRGIGIPESEVSKITEPFYRCSNARGHKGFGIGLALSHKIIKLNKGTMQITSQLNRGTQVKVFFPISE